MNIKRAFGGDSDANEEHVTSSWVEKNHLAIKWQRHCLNYENFPEKNVDISLRIPRKGWNAAWILLAAYNEM